MGFALPGLLRRATGTTLAVGVATAGLLALATAPASAAPAELNNPTIASTDYPPTSTGQYSGGSGITGSFTFSANGSSDVVGFRYGEFGSLTDYVAADAPGGTATIQFAPSSVNYDEIFVEGVTAEQATSAEVGYSFYVVDNLPKVTCGPGTDYLGTPQQCTFTPAAGSDVTGYDYAFNGSPRATVSGSTATVSVTPVNGFDQLRVWARLGNSNLTGDTDAWVHADPGTPTIAQSAQEVTAGTPVTFTFTAVLPGSVSFTYTPNGGAMSGVGTPVTIPVGADGTATVTLPANPTYPTNWYQVNVFSTNAAGQHSGTASAGVQVDPSIN